MLSTFTISESKRSCLLSGKFVNICEHLIQCFKSLKRSQPTDLIRFNFFLRTRRSGVRISQGAPFYKGFSDLPLKTAPPCYQFATPR